MEKIYRHKICVKKDLEIITEDMLTRIEYPMCKRCDGYDELCPEYYPLWMTNRSREGG